MRVLFLGFGDLAQRSARLFLSQGWEVTGLRRTLVQVPGVKMVAGDCRDIRLLGQILPGHDLIVASLTPDSYTDQGYREAYVDAASALKASLDAVSTPPGLLMWVSSTSVYGESNGEWVDENTPAKPGSFTGRALLEGERIISECRGTASVIRFSGIYGPGRERLLRLVKTGKCAPPMPVQWSNRIHADDCAGVVFHLANRFFSGQPLDAIYIGTDCKPAPLHEVCSWLAEQLNVVFNAAETSAGRSNRRCSNKRLLQTGYQFIYPTFREGYRALMTHNAI